MSSVWVPWSTKLPLLSALSPEALVTVSIHLRIRLGGPTMTSRSGCSQSLKCHLLPQTPQELNTKLSLPVYSGPGTWRGQVMWFFFLPLSPQVQGWREHIQKKASLLSACSGFHHLSHNFISCQSLKPLSRRHLSLLCSVLPKATVRRGF